MFWYGAREKRDCPTALYKREQSFLREIMSLGEPADKVFVGGQFFSTDSPNAFPQGVPGDTLL